MLLVKDGRDNDTGMVSSVCQNHDGCPPLTDSRREEWHAGRASRPSCRRSAPLCGPHAQRARRRRAHAARRCWADHAPRGDLGARRPVAYGRGGSERERVQPGCLTPAGLRVAALASSWGTNAGGRRLRRRPRGRSHQPSDHAVKPGRSPSQSPGRYTWFRNLEMSRSGIDGGTCDGTCTWETV
jgi:hypothetical protein